MEMLMLTLWSISVYLVWRKPEKEKTAFLCFNLGTAICIIVYAVAAWNSFLPFGTL